METTEQDYGCRPGVTHSPTKTAWRNGCRHPGAVAAHDEWIAEKRAQRKRAMSAAAGECMAATHGTRYAYEMSGCRCPKALAAHRKHAARANDAERARRARDYSLDYSHERMRAKRLTGGRLDYDPRRVWRGGNAGVSTVSVLHVMAGYQIDATHAEKMVAVLRLARRQVWDRGDWKTRPHWRAPQDQEIADVIGTSANNISRMRKRPAVLRENRTERRAADARWRAAIRAAAEDDPGRKDRERRRHALAAEERDLRRRLYAVKRARRG